MAGDPSEESVSEKMPLFKQAKQDPKTAEAVLLEHTLNSL